MSGLHGRSIFCSKKEHLMKRVTSLILVLIAIMTLNAFAMTPDELTALAVKHPPVVITGTGHRNLNTKETVLILFEFDTNPWKDIYSPTTGKAIGFTPPLSLKSHYWAWEQFELYDDGTHGDRIANDGVHSLLMKMPRDNKKWQLAIDDTGTARTAHESELAHLLKSAAAEAGIGFEGHFAILPDSSKVVGMTAKHFQEMIESGEIELASQKSKTAGSVTYSDDDKKYQTYYVHSTLGDDSNSGDSPDKPLKSFYKGVAKLKINDTLIVGPGTYHIDLAAVRPFVENVENCWIVASPRGQAVITCAWKEALAGTLPWKQEKDGIYSTPDPGHLGPTGYFEHEGKITYMQKYLYDELISGKIIYKGFEDNPAIIPAHGFAVNYDENRVYLRLPDNMNPNGRSMMIQAQHPGKGADSVIMKARNTRNLIIDGLVFEGADTAIKTYGPNNGLTIRNCLFGNCQAGADISASSDTMVEWCEYTFKGLEPYMKGLLKDNPKLTRLPFLFGKQHFNNEGGLETISGLTRHTSRFNYAHGSMDGTSWGGCIDSDFHHNVVYFMLDNCIEIDTVW
ncbi:MAG: hypothetical protein HC898_01180 [Phycisphaerales bacterium]|nr:hypothetical protein [Phycisphaerales bacterium]